MVDRKSLFIAIAAMLLAGVLVPLGLSGSSDAQAAAPMTWKYTTGPGGEKTEMATPREGHTATTLDGPQCQQGAPERPEWCGKVLVVGGHNRVNASSGSGSYGVELASAELFNPRDGSWRYTGNLAKGRFDHSAVVLTGERCRVSNTCGHVLVTGGSTRDWVNGQQWGTTIPFSAELYNPYDEKWRSQDIPQDISPEYTTADSQLNPNHSATVLVDGRVLFVGRGIGGTTPWPGFIYDPGNTNRPWTTTNSATVVSREERHVAVLIKGPNCGQNCGRVLIAGNSAGVLGGRTAELFEPPSGTFLPTAPMVFSGEGSDGVALSDGTILVAGPAGSQVFDPAAGTWRATGRMTIDRMGRSFLARLPGGPVMAVSGTYLSKSELGTAPEQKRITEIFLPDEMTSGTKGTWKTVSLLNEVRGDSRVVSLGCESPSAGSLVIGGHRMTVPNGESSLASTEVFGQVPTVESVSPPSGSLRGGSVMKIRGRGFKSLISTAPVVGVGDSQALNVSVNQEGTEITATTPPAQEPGGAKISVFVGGIPTGCSEVKFEYLPIPELTGINPPNGPATGGTTVKLTGTGLAPGSSVRFGDQEARNVQVAPDGKSITVQSPPNNPGEVPVVISSPAGEVQTAFRYLPAITGVVPGEGPPEGGTTVTIAGKGFTGARMVSFDGIEVAPTDVADGLITVKSPPHPPGQVRVGVDVPPHGAAIPVAAGADTFTYGAEAVPLGGGSGQTSGGSSSVPPGSQTPTTSGGGPSAAGGSGPPPPGQGQAVPVFSQSPASIFEPGSSAMQSGSASPVQAPGGVQAPGAAGSQVPGPQPALVSVPEIRPDKAEQYAMVAYSGKGVDPAGFGLAAGLVGLLLCGGLVLGRREPASRPQARPQEAY